jgi:hypothetical protein
MPYALKFKDADKWYARGGTGYTDNEDEATRYEREIDATNFASQHNIDAEPVKVKDVTDDAGEKPAAKGKKK